MAKEKTRAQLLQDIKDLKRNNERFISVANILGTLGINLIRWGAVCLVAYWAMQAVRSLAGLQTNASIVINMLGSIALNNALAWVLAAGGLTWGFSERKVRQRQLKHLHPRIKELERIIDDHRSSSSLTEAGTTNPKDEGEF